MDGDITEEDEDRYNELLNDDDAFDLSKIAIVFDKHSKVQSIWDKNNIDITKAYNRDLKRMPIDMWVVHKIDEYLESLN
jgi:hypothetical protein